MLSCLQRTERRLTLRPINEWPTIDTILRNLTGAYARLLDIRLDGHPEDYLLWNVVDVPSIFAPGRAGRLLKFHGCAVRAAHDPANYRSLLIARLSQITAWPHSPDYALMKNALQSLAGDQAHADDRAIGTKTRISKMCLPQDRRLCAGTSLPIRPPMSSPGRFLGVDN